MNGLYDVVDTSGLMSDVVDTGLLGEVGVSASVDTGFGRASGSVSLAWVALLAIGAWFYFKK